MSGKDCPFKKGQWVNDENLVGEGYVKMRSGKDGKNLNIFYINYDDNITIRLWMMKGFSKSMQVLEINY